MTDRATGLIQNIFDDIRDSGVSRLNFDATQLCTVSSEVLTPSGRTQYAVNLARFSALLKALRVTCVA